MKKWDHVKRWIGYREFVGEIVKHTDDKISH